MRTLRSSMVATLMVALLAGFSSVVAAQADDDGSVSVTHVTGQQTDAREVGFGGYAEVGGVTQGRDLVYEDTLEWSDPRLPSAMWITENLDMHDLGDGREAWFWVGSIRLEDEQGAWAGEEYGMGEFTGDRPILQPRIMMLRGEGAYEGLTAVLQRRWDPEDVTYHAAVDGYIFEGDLPPMPAPTTVVD